jgi:hypothetical protein
VHPERRTGRLWTYSPTSVSLLRQSLLRRSLLRQSLLGGSLLRQSLLRRSLLRQSLKSRSLKIGSRTMSSAKSRDLQNIFNQCGKLRKQIRPDEC